jgi:hypothetical protein
MKNDSPKNFNCEFAPEIIDFLYSEISNERKNAFNLHLRNCSDCADEVADFSDLRFSIQDWKASEFDNLTTPKIRIPFETVKTVETEKSVSWFDSIRHYLTFSPVLSGAMAVLIFAVLVGFGIFVLSKNETGEFIASKNDNTQIINNPAASPQKNAAPVKETADNIDKDFEDNKTVQPEKEQIEKSVPVRTNIKPNPKQKSPTVKTVEKKSPNADLKNDTKNAKNVPNKNKPRLNELPEEDEDNSLRLADLFAELETKD